VGIFDRVLRAGEGRILRQLAGIAEQVNLVEDDIGQLYDNWFIETAEDWAVPYIAELIGYRPVVNTGEAGRVTTPEGRALNGYLMPRRELANTIRYRRRKGTVSLLELLARDTAAWPARVVEFFKLLSWNQNLNHLHLDRAHTVSLRRVRHLGLLDGPFDLVPHTVDVRHISSRRTAGRYNVPSVGVFVWRLKSYSVTRTPANCAENSGPHCHTFSVLGHDTPLFVKPETELRDTHIAKEMNVPAPIRRLAFAEEKERFYGEDKSLAIWVDGWAGLDPRKPVPAEAIVPADLSDWEYYPPQNHIAVDPVLGRFSFRPNQLPKKGVRVTYHYGFSADMGGGEYQRSIFDPAPRPSERPEARCRDLEQVRYDGRPRNNVRVLGDVQPHPERPAGDDHDRRRQRRAAHACRQCDGTQRLISAKTSPRRPSA